jgi:hypothetical protein
MRRIEELHLEFPFAGSRRLRDLAPDGAPDPEARSDQQPGPTEGGWLCSSMKTDDPRKPDAPIVAYYGSYTVDEAGKKIFGKIEAASYWPRANMETIGPCRGAATN